MKWSDRTCLTHWNSIWQMANQHWIFFLLKANLSLTLLAFYLHIISNHSRGKLPFHLHLHSHRDFPNIATETEFVEVEFSPIFETHMNNMVSWSCVIVLPKKKNSEWLVFNKISRQAGLWSDLTDTFIAGRTVGNLIRRPAVKSLMGHDGAFPDLQPRTYISIGFKETNRSSLSSRRFKHIVGNENSTIL